MSFFLFGVGFSGKVIARSLLAAGWEVRGTVRSLGDSGLPGVTLFPFDRSHPLPDEALEGVTHVLSAIPPDPEGDPVLDTLRDRLGQLPLQWVGYLSTTGVYGDRQGGWVDETSELRPTSERSHRRVAAEAEWLATGGPVHLFRLAGIYGPGRSVLETVRKGEARRIVKPGQVFGRIHVEDIAATILASMEKPNPGQIYNVSDDDPAPPWEVLAYAYTLLGQEPSPEIPWEEAQHLLSPMALSFYQDNKRVRNDRIKEELGVRLRYPSYREGLRTSSPETVWPSKR